MDGVESLVTLEKLELYDNHIEEVRGVDLLSNLRILDISFNSIRCMVPLAHCCPMLEELYMAQNKLRKIEGLDGLKNLVTLDLGANRIRVIEGLETTVNLRSLCLGKNKIEAVAGLENLLNLRQLDIQNNRLLSLYSASSHDTTTGDTAAATASSGLAHLSKLEELYLAWNGISSLSGGLPSSIQILDLTNNRLKSFEEEILNLTNLEEFWCSSNLIESFDDIKLLSQLQKLTCLYLEHNPVAKMAETTCQEYRAQLKLLIPSLTQIDALLV